MSTPLKILVGLLVWLLYSLIAYRGCIQDCCPGAADAITGQDSSATQESFERYPIDFQWSDATANTNDGFEELKKSTLAGLKTGQVLEITGLYFEAEPKPEGFENMGFARADQVRRLLSEIPDNQIRLRARVVDEFEGSRVGYFESALLNWIEAEKTVAKTVEELNDRIIIRFPYNSTEREYDPSVDEYLNKLAKRVAQTGEQVQLVGHTDNKGAPDFNQSLGMARAKAIKDLIAKKGVKAELISTDSKGQTQPVDNNTTEEGRHNNRRVEVRLIKKQ